MIPAVIWTFVLCTSCFDLLRWVVLAASGFMVNYGRGYFSIQPEFLQDQWNQTTGRTCSLEKDVWEESSQGHTGAGS